jgi:hypothetical protein
MTSTRASTSRGSSRSIARATCGTSVRWSIRWTRSAGAVLLGRAFDMPYASTKMTQATRNFHLAGIGYEWNTQELQRAAMLGRSLSSDKAAAADMVSQKFIYGIGMTGKNPAGVSEKGWTGFTNDANVPAVQVAADGTASSRSGRPRPPTRSCATSTRRSTRSRPTAARPSSPTRWSCRPRLQLHRQHPDRRPAAHVDPGIPAGQQLGRREPDDHEEPRARNRRHRLGARMVAYAKNPQVLKFMLPGPHQFLPPFQKARWSTRSAAS